MNGTQITSSTQNVSLTAGVPQRLRVEFTQTSGSPSVSLFWIPPGTVLSVMVPVKNLMRPVICSTPCINGCCIDDNVCSCFQGYGGPDCSTPMATCNNGTSTMTNGYLQGIFYSGLNLQSYWFTLPGKIHEMPNVPRFELC